MALPLSSDNIPPFIQSCFFSFNGMCVCRRFSANFSRRTFSSRFHCRFCCCLDSLALHIVFFPLVHSSTVHIVCNVWCQFYSRASMHRRSPAHRSTRVWLNGIFDRLFALSLALISRGSVCGCIYECMLTKAQVFIHLWLFVFHALTSIARLGSPAKP